MMDHQRIASREAAARQRARIAELRDQLDEREETIRLLNEALSRALDELERTGKIAA